MTLLWINTIFASSLYQWKDSNGVWHFSNVAPDDYADSVEELPEAVGTSETNTDDNRNSYSTNSKTSTSFSSDKTNESSGRSICSQTIDYTNESITTSIETAKQNMQGGYITEEQYNQAKKSLLSLKNKISVNGCINAAGKEKKFYDCLTDSYGFIVPCVSDAFIRGKTSSPYP